MVEENKHIPKFIRERPWYLKGDGVDGEGDGEDKLSHHRLVHGQVPIDHSEPKMGSEIVDVFKVVGEVSGGRGKRLGGSRCENCGSAAHKKRDCLERPRKQRREGGVIGEAGGAFAVRDEAGLKYDAKRDRWFGYDAEDHERRSERRAHVTAGQTGACVGAVEEDSVEDLDWQVERYKLGLLEDQQVRGDSSEGVPSIRARDDKALYLDDFNSDEIRYDPKSRLYKTDELGSLDPETKMFHRHLNGDSTKLEALSKKVRSIESQSGIRDDDVDVRKVGHVLAANPTKYEIMLLRGNNRSTSDAHKNGESSKERSAGENGTRTNGANKG
ncbi:HGL096Cp [Eremothecium sinecaudum]|uniref:Pre-mRNA-splicing factor SLU7 n=1 Tax=Eremothecium sinecaudum TaxID=45286 RepID=A0A0X8HVF6_9SACH|nr:HGL096Cp [Eremothecium sinecaudum]AMD22244.1 HGL096Cp [Eremothecium sinecaudum]